MGHFVVTFPGAFHQGYNTGDNIFEARNFSSPGWPQWAKKNLGQYCDERCNELLVNIRLDNLLRKVCLQCFSCSDSFLQSASQSGFQSGRRADIKAKVPKGFESFLHTLSKMGCVSYLTI